MPRETPFALQKRVPVLFHDQKRPVKDISDIIGTSVATVYSILSNYRTYGTPHNPLARTRGRSPLLTHVHLQFISQTISENPVIYQDEIQALLRATFGVSVSLATICRAISSLDYSYVRVSKAAAERNELLRRAFRGYAGQIVQFPDQPIFIDESAKDKKTYERRFGYAKKGQRCIFFYPFVRGRRLSLVCALGVTGLVGSQVCEGAVDSNRFLAFLRDHVIPNTTPYPGPRSVIILDNCNIHHSSEVRQLVEAAGCKLLFLPPYSPDMTPIEEAFAAIKAWLRRHANNHTGRIAPIASIHAACETVTPEKARGWFRHTGWA